MDLPPLDFNALQLELEALRVQHGIPGLGFVLLEQGQLSASYFLGYAKIEDQVPVSPPTIFEAASLTKPLFAYAVLKLAESGALNLDIPLDDYLPAPYLPDDPRSHLITARSVLCHTAGFPNWVPDGEPLRLEFPPGQRFAYSGEGYVFLQKVVERITGLPIEPWLQSCLIQPLGLTPADASLVWQPAFDLTCATAYNAQNEPVERERTSYGNVAYSLRCTPAAYARFLSRMVQRETRGISWLSDASYRLMLTPAARLIERGKADQVPPVHIPGLFWGLGWGLSQAGERQLFWQWGDNGEFQSLAVGEPGTGRSLVVMANSKSGIKLWPVLVQRVFGEPHPLLVWLRRYQP
jgi:CubicO group peptidase (beta-lactamase class C family)